MGGVRLRVTDAASAASRGVLRTQTNRGTREAARKNTGVGSRRVSAPGCASRRVREAPRVARGARSARRGEGTGLRSQEAGRARSGRGATGTAARRRWPVAARGLRVRRGAPGEVFSRRPRAATSPAAPRLPLRGGSASAHDPFAREEPQAVKGQLTSAWASLREGAGRTFKAACAPRDNICGMHAMCAETTACAVGGGPRQRGCQGRTRRSSGPRATRRRRRGRSGSPTSGRCGPRRHPDSGARRHRRIADRSR